MQRRHRDACLEIADGVIVDQAALLETFSAMDHPVADRLDLMQGFDASVLLAYQHAEYIFNTCLVINYFTFKTHLVAIRFFMLEK